MLRAIGHPFAHRRPQSGRISASADRRVAADSPTYRSAFSDGSEARNKLFDSILLTEYSYIMGKTDKLLDKARDNPSGLAFAEFETLLGRLGWRFDRQSGSHRIWISPRGERLPIQSRQGEAKAYQVKQFLRINDDDTNEKN